MSLWLECIFHCNLGRPISIDIEERLKISQTLIFSVFLLLMSEHGVSQTWGKYLNVHIDMILVAVKRLCSFRGMTIEQRQWPA